VQTPATLIYRVFHAASSVLEQSQRKIKDLFLPNPVYDDKISHVRFCVKERGVADGEVLRDLQEGHHVGQHSQPFKQKIPEDLGSQRSARQRGD